MKNFPLVTIVIPTYNEEKTLDKCLSSIFNQSYPKAKLEIFVVDNYSSDRTLDIAQKYPVKILMNKVIDNLTSKMLALRKARGEYFIYFDSDIELVGENWFEKALFPLVKDSQIVASFPGFIPKTSDSPLNRYLSYDTLQRDPIYEYFSPSVESCFKKVYPEYVLCQYLLNKIPPSGLCLFRKKCLLQVWNNPQEKRFIEVDNLVRLVKAGYTNFAYVPDIKIHHDFVDNLSDLLKKRLRNIKKNYLSEAGRREYRWFNLETPQGTFKVVSWVFLASTIIFLFIRGVYKSLKHKDWACLYEPLVAFSETWVIIFGFLFYSVKK